MVSIIRAALCCAAGLLAGCGGADYTPAPITASGEIAWTQQPDVQGAPPGNYLAVVPQGGGAVAVYSNFAGPDNTAQAKLYAWHGTLAALNGPRVVLDVPSAFLRTLAVQRSAATGVCYALLRLGTVYGQSSYYPAFARSDANCENWTLVREKLWLGNSNSLTLTLNDAAPPAVDHAQPRSNRFTAVDDSFGRRLALAYSADGETWYSTAAELYPPAAGGNPQFAAEVRTPTGYHLIAADWVDAQGAAVRHVHLYSCDGAAYRVLDGNAPTYNGPKGTALAYTPEDNTVHAITGAQHLTFKATQLPCPQ